MSDDSLSLFSGGADPGPGATSESGPADATRDDVDAPLAERMRPRSLDEIVGQSALVGPDGLVRKLQDSGRIPSLILHGPPGTGKTTLGRLLAGAVGAAFVPFSAVSEGVPRLREIMKAAELRRRSGRRTLVFVDEIHRLNKGQQDFLLPYVESGQIVLVGATTEHPAFEVNPALLSRTRVLVLEPLSADHLRLLVQRALADSERGVGAQKITLTDAALSDIVDRSGGDARQALTVLEIATELVGPGGTIDEAVAVEALQQRMARYDTTTAFQMLSAFHKSLRSSQGDAALYWAMRMIDNGEDPLVLFRRTVAAAYEDVGLADPQAGMVATLAMTAYERLGPPEGFLPLSNAILYVANAPKSNRGYLALAAAKAASAEHPDAPVPLHLRNASTSLMREWGFGAEYRYAHDFDDAYVEIQCLPDEISDARSLLRSFGPGRRGRRPTCR